MLSICIPVYNFDVHALIEDLVLQGDKLECPYELIVIDDCSQREFKEKNQVSCRKTNYTELTKNIGRAKIRNLFLEHAKYENLLFLDCDSLIIKDVFLQNYVNEIQKNNYKVIFGGRIYPNSCPSRSQKLSWKYGTVIESKDVFDRKLHPNKSFMTNNFLIKRDIFSKIKFDENLYKYGHEDTLFGFQLMLNIIEITHIENPILNGDIETNKEYLKKTEQGILNLIFIYQTIENKNLFAKNVSLLNYYTKFKSKHLTIFISLIFGLLKHPILFLLKNGFINLKLFNFYKLGFFIKNYK